MASIVIKVKYEQTLRRFNVAVKGDQQLDLSIEGLRLKISSLFNLPSDAGFSLTYEDEDDDLVTLGDDEDLHDMVRQGLDPVRITVRLNSDQSVQPSPAPSSGSAASNTPPPENVQSNIYPNVAEVLKSVQEPLSQVLLNLRSATSNSQKESNPDIAKIVKSVQEPLAHALTKLSLDMSSKAASTTPILAEIIDGLSKMGQSYLNAAHSHSGASSVSSHEVRNDSKPNSSDRKPEGSVEHVVKYDNIDIVVQAHPAPKSTQAIGEVGSPLCPSFSFDKGKNASCESSSSKMSSIGGMNKKKDATARKKGVGLSADFLRTAAMDASEKEFLREAAKGNRGFQSYCERIPMGECPFSGTPLTRKQIFKQFHPSNTIFNKADNLGSMFHKGVRCDGCNVIPITGPRFKSKVKYDYDLCSTCFSRIGNVRDYTRIELPMAYQHPWSFQAPDAKRPHASKHPRSRLDSRFIKDVNVMDGTTMAPSTPFTKIWQMRNNGTLPWNRGLQLLWIGGDRFSPSDSVEIEVPFTGVDVGYELNIAVDFVAPELPGRYISYWRMAEPSGHKFGQRVWVQIQVDPSVDLTRESSPMLNLNLPPESKDEAVFPLVADVKVESGFSVEAIEVGESSGPSTLEQSHKIETVGVNFPVNDDLLVGGDMLYPSSAAASPSVTSAPGVDMPVAPLAPSLPSFPEADAPSSAAVSSSVSPAAGADAFYRHIAFESDAFQRQLQSAYGLQAASAPPLSLPATDEKRNLGNNSNLKQASEKIEVQKTDTDVEEKLLKELEQMGFKQFDLNKEVLQKNEFDLGRSVDDLCCVLDWDPILEELKEMGFEDKETNQKLLAKNNGSITRVVMDLIAEEQA